MSENFIETQTTTEKLYCKNIEGSEAEFPDSCFMEVDSNKGSGDLYDDENTCKFASGFEDVDKNQEEYRIVVNTVEAENRKETSFSKDSRYINEDFNAGISRQRPSVHIDSLIGNYKRTEERVFVCAVCKLSLSNLSELNFHYSSHKDYMEHSNTKNNKDHMSKKYICLVCDKDFRRQQDLIIHEKWHKSGISYHCLCCGKEFCNVKLLLLHMVEEHTGDISIYGSVRNRGLTTVRKLSSDNSDKSVIDISTPKSCGESLSVTYQLEHEKVEKETTVFLFCDTCGKGFAKREALIRHLFVHSEQKSFICAKCSNGFASKERLTKHMKIHNEDMEFICDICGSCFRLRARLSQHIKQVHGIERPFVCSTCGHRFKMKNKLTEHVKLHSEEKTFLCSVCGKGFRWKCNLNQHMQLHSEEKAFACSVCGKRFLHKHYLKSHKKIHLTIKPFVCFWCGKGFRTTGDLVRHERIHSGDTPFKCYTCGKGFAQKVQLRLHYKVHPPP